MDTLFSQLAKVCKPEEIKCAFVHISHGYDFSELSPIIGKLDPIVVIKKVKLFVPFNERNKKELTDFCDELDRVPAKIGNDSYWDCSGTIWLVDGDWLALKATKNIAYFERNYAPSIPDELIDNDN